ncbi:MAG: hypothetical protein C0412_05730 [Flavobacterium sp.]|nr:hypothetical protein [Flavobacterium sp.]
MRRFSFYKCYKELKKIFFLFAEQIQILINRCFNNLNFSNSFLPEDKQGKGVNRFVILLGYNKGVVK